MAISDRHPPRLDLRSLIRLRCPACGEGRIFSGAVRMNRECDRCGLRFEREPSGYFTGAMYFSYALALPILVGLTALIIGIAPGWPKAVCVGLALVGFVPLIPLVFRYSRGIFIHLDQALDPEP